MGDRAGSIPRCCPTQLERPWATPAEAVAAALVTDPAAGLTDGEVADRLRLVGSNELVERGRKSPWRLLAEQFANTMILVAAAVVTAVIGDLLRGQVEGCPKKGRSTLPSCRSARRCWPGPGRSQR